jgi:hypothetical protein
MNRYVDHRSGRRRKRPDCIKSFTILSLANYKELKLLAKTSLFLSFKKS